MKSTADLNDRPPPVTGGHVTAGLPVPAAPHAYPVSHEEQRPPRTNRWVPRGSPWQMLALLAAAHFVVDLVAGTTSPLWPVLEKSLALKTGGLLWVYVCWSIATSFGQLLFAVWADRRPSPWLIWGGPLVAVVLISCVGVASSSTQLAAVLVVGGLGIAAFHPEAAASSGSLLPAQRSRTMAIFALCGYLGQSVGPFYSGAITDRLGPRGLTWGLAWGGPLVVALWLGLRHAARPSTTSALPSRPPAPTPAAKPHLPITTLALLLAVGALRILPALGVPLALAYLLKATATSNSQIGAVQSAFMAGVGIGAMGCAAFVRHEWERAALWVFPVLTAPLLLLLDVPPGWTLNLLVGLCGILLGVTMPVYISYGQQLLPHGQRVASSITMGVSWGISGGVVAAAISLLNAAGNLPSIYLLFAVSSLASSLLCFLLPAPSPPASLRPPEAG